MRGVAGFGGLGDGPTEILCTDPLRTFGGTGLDSLICESGGLVQSDAKK